MPTPEPSQESPPTQAYTPVAVGVRKKPALQPTIQMVNTRASHFYFKRVFQMLRALGKYQRA